MMMCISTTCRSPSEIGVEPSKRPILWTFFAMPDGAWRSEGQEKLHYLYMMLHRALY